ncbi:MAG: response regulator transcription factor [Rhodothermales bacterium]|nr:response regulator transcription factor [Rhodothermales bacterium]
MERSYQVLYVEDDPQIGALVAGELEAMHCTVQWCHDGETGLHAFRERPFDLVVLDLMLPGLSGLDVCRRIRQVNPFVPIVMLTAKADMRDVVRGLELGADDYVTKPFRTAELLARIKALFRRVEADRAWQGLVPDEAMLVRGRLVLYPDLRKVTLDGARVDLTAKEFDLLLLFARHPGRAFRRADLLEAVWGTRFEGYDHTVNTHINRLRGKIEPDPSSPVYIQTLWGVGYRFAEQEELQRL